MCHRSCLQPNLCVVDEHPIFNITLLLILRTTLILLTTMEKDMSFTPLFDNILIQELAAETKTKSGLLLPTSELEKPSQAKVIAVGPGKLQKNGQYQTMTVAVGDVVLYGKYHSGEKISLDGTEYIIMKESELLAKVQQ